MATLERIRETRDKVGAVIFGPTAEEVRAERAEAITKEVAKLDYFARQGATKGVLGVPFWMKHAPFFDKNRTYIETRQPRLRQLEVARFAVVTTCDEGLFIAVSGGVFTEPDTLLTGESYMLSGESQVTVDRGKPVILPTHLSRLPAPQNRLDSEPFVEAMGKHEERERVHSMYELAAVLGALEVQNARLFDE